jgi:signal recognition particle subunit SRP54
MKGAIDQAQNSKALVHMEAMLSSMTAKERAKPDVINAKRKIRIAKGSGTTVQEINKLLKMHQEMSTAMKRLKKMGGLGKLAAMFGGGGGLGGLGGIGGAGGAGGLPGLGGSGSAALPGLGGNAFNLPPGFDKFSKK